MPNFEQSFEFMIKNEGGYILHKTEGDRGGQTYAGIARNFWPKWEGWKLIDNEEMDNPSLTQLVKEFYIENFWNRVKGDLIKEPAVSKTIFDFAVNAGVRTASKLSQLVVGATPDGIIGPKTIGKINEIDTERFSMAFTLAKIERYKEICRKDRTQRKFLYNWVTRSLKGL